MTFKASGFRWLQLFAFFCCAVAGRSSFFPANTPRADFWDVDGPIYSMVTTNGRIYVGGDFSYVAPKGSKLIALDRYTGEVDSDFPSFFGSAIYAIVEDLQGGWFVAGDFTQVGQLARTNLVHILADNTVDPYFRPDPDAPVRCLALQGDLLFFGGDFTSAGGQTRNRLAAWDLASQALTTWAPAANATVAAILVSGDLVYVGGYFTQIAGELRRNLVSFSVGSENLLAWNQAQNFFQSSAIA